MIISVSRRTDIPAFYSEWFMKRLQDGYLMVRNPMNYHQINKISLISYEILPVITLFHIRQKLHLTVIPLFLINFELWFT